MTERSLGGCVTLAGAICPYRDAVNWRGGRVFRFVSVALYAAIALGFIARSADGALTMPSNSDWVAFAVGAHLLRSGGCLYCVGSQIAATHAMGLAPGDGINPFVSLPPVGFVFQPLGLLAPEQVIAATLAVCAALFAAAVALTGDFSRPIGTRCIASEARSSPPDPWWGWSPSSNGSGSCCWRC